MSGFLKSVFNVPDPSMIEKSGGRSLIDPIGASNPSMRRYTDPFNFIYKGSMEDYRTGLTPEEQAAEDRHKAAVAYGQSLGIQMKKGGKVKSKPKKKATGGYVRAADGIAKKGKTKGRFI